jgi:hypothetical protein
MALAFADALWFCGGWESALWNNLTVQAEAVWG